MKMKKIINKKVIIPIIILVLTLSLVSVGFAAGEFKSLKAWFGDIKIFVNQQQVQLDVKPFIVNGTTYVPLRALSDIFNKDVSWDGTNKRIDINDNPDESVNYMMNLITSKQNEINELKAKNAELEKQLAEQKTSSNYTLTDLEKYLNKQHGTYKKVEFDIYLSGNKNDIDVKIDVDLDDYYSKWNSLSSSDIKSFVQDIVDDIKHDFKDADVDGYIRDSSRSKKLVDFYVSSRGSLVIDSNYSSSSSYDLSDLESDLNYYYDRYESVNFDIKLSGNKDSIRVYVEVDEYDWSRLSKSDRESYLEKLYDDINYEYPYAEVYGYVDDYRTGREINYFDFDSKGYVYIK